MLTDLSQSAPTVTAHDIRVSQGFMANEASEGMVRPEYSEKDKSRARQWFKKAETLREQRNYDYAIESYTSGLGFWMDAIDEGILPLWSLAIQRQQAGGKKPGMMESMKKSTTGKDVKQATLNSLALLAKDPTSATYVDAVLKNAARGGYLDLIRWAAERALESLKREKKTNAARFKAYRETLVAAGQMAESFEEPAYAVSFLEFAAQSLDFLVARNPSEMSLKDLQREISGKLTIAKGKYSGSGDFRDSLQDADKQRVLHDAERLKQGEAGQADLLLRLKTEFEENPTVPKHINAYVDTLIKTEKSKAENEAIRVLEEVAANLKNYNFKLKADDVRLRQLARRTSRLRIKAKESGSDEDRQQVRLAQMEELQAQLGIFAERVAKYPTDLRIKAKYGEALFRSKQYDEAIPILQAAQNDPRARIRCQLLIGQSFHKTGNPAQAAEVLAEALEEYEREDDTACSLLYSLGIAQTEAGDVSGAKTSFGKLLRIDYNYANGDARKRLDELKQST